jgi:CubicO group peptidase (beta-lactamase class C family)
VLATVIGTDSERAVQERICIPLWLRDAATPLSEEQRQPVVPSRTARGNPTPPLELRVLAGAGALRSTADRLVWHNGATGGFNSCIAFKMNEGVGICVLINRSPSLLSFSGLGPPLAEGIAFRILKSLSTDAEHGMWRGGLMASDRYSRAGTPCIDVSADISGESHESSRTLPIDNPRSYTLLEPGRLSALQPVRLFSFSSLCPTGTCSLP